MERRILPAPNIIKETSRGLDVVSLPDAFFSQRKLFLISEVTAETMNDLLMQLMYLEAQDSEEPVVLYINSPGGEVTSGLAVYDFMRMMKRPLITICTGTAASMGAVLFLGADKRYMLPHSKIMIHDASYGKANFSGLKPDELQVHLDDLRKVSHITAGIIAERTGQPLETVESYTRKDSFFDSEEAMKFGLATAVVKSIDMMDIEREAN